MTDYSALLNPGLIPALIRESDFIIRQNSVIVNHPGGAFQLTGITSQEFSLVSGRINGQRSVSEICNELSPFIPKERTTEILLEGAGIFLEWVSGDGTLKSVNNYSQILDANSRHFSINEAESAHPNGWNRIGIIGGGTAGYLTALAFKTRYPRLDVTLVESSAIPVIGVGEATTPQQQAKGGPFHQFQRVGRCVAHWQHKQAWHPRNRLHHRAAG